MPLKTRFTKRVFTRDILPPPLTKDEVWRTLGGPAIGKALEKYITMLEFLEDLYPTDEDANEYREFLLGQGDRDLARLGFSELTARAVIKKFVEIRGLITTNNKHQPGQRPRAYIYDPRITDTLEEVYKDYRRHKYDGEPYPVDPRYIGPTGKVIVERMPTPSKDEFKACRGSLEKLLHLVAAVENTIGGPERGDTHAEFYWQGVRAQMREKMGERSYWNTLARARRLGLIKRTTDEQICGPHSTFIFNGDLGGLLLEAWQEREAAKAAKAEKRAAREARRVERGKLEAARAARERGEWLTGQLVAVDFPAVDEAAMLSTGWTAPTWKNLAALSEYLEAHGAADLVDGKHPEFIMGWDGGSIIYGTPCKHFNLITDKAVAVGLIHPTRAARSAVTPRAWTYNPAAGAIVKQIWRGIVERREAQAAMMVERGKRRGRRGGGV